MLTIFLCLVFIVIGYFIGSFNTANFIATKFFNTDLKKHGSGNLGGTNAGRVLGKKIGLLVVVIDILKTFLFIAIFSKVDEIASIYGATSIIIGHCFPYQLNFKGGKGVASYVGMLLGLGIFIFKDITFIFACPLLFFLLVLGLSKIVSLSSLLMCLSAFLISLLISENAHLPILLLFLTLLVFLKHTSNIIRIIKRKESQVSWLK